MGCQYCGWNKNHHPACPHDDRSPRIHTWKRGWSDGRKGLNKQEFNASYGLGWGQGNIARETAENS